MAGNSTTTILSLLSNNRPHPEIPVKSLCLSFSLSLLRLSLEPMAPSKRLLKDVEVANEVKPAVELASGRRVTRSLTRPADSVAGGSAAASQPRKRAKKSKAEKNDVPVSDVDEKKNVEGSEKKDDTGASDSNPRTIIVEHCKQCNSFKTRAMLVKEGLEKAISGITVLLNPEKPRRGCFEIREDGGVTFISLPNMKRPFKPMKELDMEQVISDIVGKIQA